MAIAVELPGSIKIVNPVPTDYVYGPFATVAAAKAGVPLALRYDGLTVQVTGSGNYWWLSGNLTDAGLIVKIPIGTVVTGTFAPPGVLFADTTSNIISSSQFTYVESFPGPKLTITQSVYKTEIRANQITLTQDATTNVDYFGTGVNVNGTTGKFEIKQVGVTNFPGATYFADYSANYVARSLVDKAYVDAHVGGITNTAAANEIPKSDNVNIVPSGLFSTTLGDLILGGAALAGTLRKISANGNAADVAIDFIPKGAAGLTFRSQLAMVFYDNFSGSEVNSITIKPSLQTIFTSYQTAAALTTFQISSANGIAGLTTGQHLFLKSGNGYASGNTDAGNIMLDTGIVNGLGKYGNFAIFSSVGTFGGGERVVFQGNANTNPTSNPTAGYIIYGDGSNSSHPTVRLPSGSIIDLVNSWQLSGTSTFTGAVLIDETSTGGNTLKFKTAALGVTSVDGKGIWLYNDTTATAGAQQISGAITQEGQGHATTPVNSQSVKFKFYVTPIQGAVNPTGQWDLYQSINAAAYTSLLTAHSSGIIAIGTGTNTPGLVNGVQYSGTYTRLHLWSTAQTLMVIDAANTAATLVFNDRGQSANSRVWGIGNSGAKLLFQAFSDGLVNTDLFQLTRAGNASWLGLSYFGALTAPIHTVDVGGSFGANITSTSVDITLNATHYTVKVDASGANRTITLPAASGVTRRIYIIKKTDSSANTVTIDGNASETIDGATTKVINTQNTGYQIQCDGTNWIIIGAF